MIVLAAGAGAVILAVFMVGRLGDDLNGWLQIKDRWLGWRERSDRRSTPYLWAVAAVVAVYVAVKVPVARSLGEVGVVTSSSLAWAMAQQALRLWPLLLLIVAACWMVQANQRHRRYMKGEPGDRRGKARAALLHLTGDAVSEALAQLRGKGEHRTPRAGTTSFFSTTVGGRTQEWGLRVRLEMAYGMTPAGLRKFGSDGMDPEQDVLATNTSKAMGMLASSGGPEVRTVLAYAKTLPVYSTTAVVPIRLKDGSPNPGAVDLLLLRKNPLREKYLYPKTRPKVAHLGCPILIGLDIQAGPASILLRERMTGVYGASGSGKSYLVQNVAIGASQCPNVAFVVIDMKGESGDLAALHPRAAAVATNPEAALVTLRWLFDELDRRQNLPGQVGKITRFSAEMPEIVVFADEWHEWAYPDPSKEAGEDRMALMARLVRRARAYGIYFVAATQIAHAKDIPTTITGQFGNVISTRLGKREHSDMVFTGQLPAGVGPHLIRPDMQGVAYGRFGEGGEIGMMKSLLSGPAVAQRWMKADAKAGLRVELPGLVEALEQRPEVERVLSMAGAPKATLSIAVPTMPAEALEAARYCWTVLDEDEPLDTTAKDLRALSVRARTRVNNGSGATPEQRAVVDADRETLRLFLQSSKSPN